MFREYFFTLLFFFHSSAHKVIHSQMFSDTNKGLETVKKTNHIENISTFGPLARNMGVYSYIGNIYICIYKIIYVYTHIIHKYTNAICVYI